MWMLLLLPFMPQSVRIDQVNGSWALVERKDGELVDVHAECLGPDVREGVSVVLTPQRMMECAPGTYVAQKAISLEENAQAVR